jgi:hypothetical protein
MSFGVWGFVGSAFADQQPNSNQASTSLWTVGIQ